MARLLGSLFSLPFFIFYFSFFPPKADQPLAEIFTSGAFAAEPSLQILSPKNEEVIEATSVEVKLKVENFTLDKENIGKDRIEGHGHAHLLVDGKFTGDVLDDVAITTDSYLLENLTPGVHKITVLLHNNDHSPTVPYYSDSVNIVVQEAKKAPPRAQNNLLPYALGGLIAIGLLGLGGYALLKFKR